MLVQCTCGWSRSYILKKGTTRSSKQLRAFEAPTACAGVGWGGEAGYPSVRLVCKEPNIWSGLTRSFKVMSIRIRLISYFPCTINRLRIVIISCQFAHQISKKKKKKSRNSCVRQAVELKWKCVMILEHIRSTYRAAKRVWDASKIIHVRTLWKIPDQHCASFMRILEPLYNFWQLSSAVFFCCRQLYTSPGPPYMSTDHRWLGHLRSVISACRTSGDQQIDI